MSERKSFLLRVDRELLDAVQRWANDDLRSLNGQIEYLLRDSLKRARRHPKHTPPASPAEATAAHESEPEE
ncbi:MAG: Arc family DNA-binding protein [Gemmatimonadetes bacterium]|nr:Arc family DNA-binding protein [Gemmatimonadota bacterium]